MMTKSLQTISSMDVVVADLRKGAPMIPAISQVTTLNASFEKDIEDYSAAACRTVEIWLGKLETYLEQHTFNDVRRLLADNELAAPVGGLALPFQRLAMGAGQRALDVGLGGAELQFLHVVGRGRGQRDQQKANQCKFSEAHSHNYAVGTLRAKLP